MPEFHLLWTALPRRIDGTELVVDAFVSPRLGINEPAGSTLTLADFPTLTDWPSQIKDHLTFEVEFSGATPAVAATRVPLTAAESNVDLDQATWAALFPPDDRCHALVTAQRQRATVLLLPGRPGRQLHHRHVQSGGHRRA